MKKLSLLLLATLLLSACCQKKTANITVINDSSLDRVQETVELRLDEIYKALNIKEGSELTVTAPCGKQLPSQIISTPCGGQKLLFQVCVKAGDTVVFNIQPGQADSAEIKAQTTFMPRRKDDMSWENDRICFRMYGPALVKDPKEGMVSGGLDIWVKRSPKLVSQKWYQDEFDGKSSYHHDNGEGLDFYSVGTTLGAGAMAPFIDNRLWFVDNNFVEYKILENGPIRTVFCLKYEPYTINGVEVAETRLITLDAGSNLNKFMIRYDSLTEPMIVAAGFPFRGFATKSRTRIDQRGIDDCKDIVYDKEAGYVAYAEPENPENGIIFLGSLMTTPVENVLIAENHVLNCTQAQPGKPVVYYSGGGWSKGGFENLEAWQKYMADYAAKIKQPLKVIGPGACCCKAACQPKDKECAK